MITFRTYSTFDAYKRAFFPDKENKLPYDKPEEFGKALADQHLQIIREAMKQWVTESKQNLAKTGKDKPRKNNGTV